MSIIKAQLQYSTPFCTYVLSSYSRQRIFIQGNGIMLYYKRTIRVLYGIIRYHKHITSVLARIISVLPGIMSYKNIITVLQPYCSTFCPTTTTNNTRVQPNQQQETPFITFMKSTAPTGEAATFFIPLEGGFLIQYAQHRDFGGAAPKTNSAR